MAPKFLWTLLTGSKFKALLIEGNKALQAGRNVEALEAFRKVVRLWPTRQEGYEGMSRSYLAMGLRLESNREQTIADSMQILAEKPYELEPRVELAKALYEKEMYGWAASHINAALKQAPNNPEVLLLSARIFRTNRNYSKAAEVLRKALRANPLEATLYEQLAFCLRAVHRAQEAVKVASIAKALKAVEQNPDSAEILDRAVRQFLAGGQRNLAITLVDRSLAANPDRAGVQRLRGELHLVNRNSKEAIVSLRKSLDLNVADLRTHRLLSQAYAAEGYQERAQKHMHLAQTLEAARKGGDLLATSIATVKLLLDSGQVEDALSRAQQLMKSEPHDWRSPFALGLVMKYLNRPKDALAAYTRAAKLDGKQAEPHLEIALLLSDLGKPIEAVGEARRAVSLAPRNPAIRRSLAQVLRVHGFLDQAVEEEELAESLAARSG